MCFSVRSFVVTTAGGACGGAALLAGACVIAVPPELPPVVPLPPRISHDSVTPPAGFPLPAWPSPPDDLVLVVPVIVEDPYGQYDYRVFVDYPQWPDPLVQQPPAPPVVDGGATLSIRVNPQQPNRRIDLGACHEIKVLVARSFLPDRPMPDSLGGDSASWPYYPSSAPYACTVADAGAGAPILDGASEGLPVPPLSDGGDR